MVTKKLKCVIIGANQAGVSCAFAMRQEGWEGEIILFDSSSELPYYRPPLSKSILTGEEKLEDHILKPKHLYEKENIDLRLGQKVVAIKATQKAIVLENGSVHLYDKLVLATGGNPIIPNIPGIALSKNIYTIRNAGDVEAIHHALDTNSEKRVVIVGAGYIGLETAASLTKMNARVTVLEREERVLARVTAPEMSKFYNELHSGKGVEIFTGKDLNSIVQNGDLNVVQCADGSLYQADVIVLGIGIKVNQELADAAGLRTDNGILIDESTRTSDENIYAIGDCSRFYSSKYDCRVRLESVQNANDQAKVAAASICGKEAVYSAVPWFWSDQYNVKLQIVGLSIGYDNTIIRKEHENKFSIWYFKNDELLAVDAVNDMKAYMIGTKFLKNGAKIDKEKLGDVEVIFKPANLIRD